MAPIEGFLPGDELLRQQLKENILGSELGRYPIVGTHGVDSLEEWLLKFRAKLWQKFLTKWFGIRFNLGYFKKVNHRDYTNWFLFWCNRCEQFQVNYKQGFDNHLPCKNCQNDFLCF